MSRFEFFITISSDRTPVARERPCFFSQHARQAYRTAHVKEVAEASPTRAQEGRDRPGLPESDRYTGKSSIPRNSLKDSGKGHIPIFTEYLRHFQRVQCPKSAGTVWILQWNCNLIAAIDGWPRCQRLTHNRGGSRPGDLMRFSPKEKQVTGSEPEDPVNEVEQERRSHPDPARVHSEIMLRRQRLRRAGNRA